MIRIEKSVLEDYQNIVIMAKHQEETIANQEQIDQSPPLMVSS